MEERFKKIISIICRRNVQRKNILKKIKCQKIHLSSFEKKNTATTKIDHFLLNVN